MVVVKTRVKNSNAARETDPKEEKKLNIVTDKQEKDDGKNKIIVPSSVPSRDALYKFNLELETRTDC